LTDRRYDRLRVSRHQWVLNADVTRICASFLAVLLLTLAGGCGGDDDEENAQRPVDGTFVGKVSGSEALVAVVASPPTRGQDRREVTVFVSDGKRLGESFTALVVGNSFRAKSGDLQAEGELTRAGTTGTVTLASGEAERYRATRATAAAGLYELTVARDGTLSGASAAGVGLSSRSTLRAPGGGTLRFADGRRRRFDLTGGSTDDPVRLRGGEVRLIVLPDGEMGGAGEGRPTGGDELEIFLRGSAE
jgi:hypothetical protein